MISLVLQKIDTSLRTVPHILLLPIIVISSERQTFGETRVLTRMCHNSRIHARDEMQFFDFGRGAQKWVMVENYAEPFDQMLMGDFCAKVLYCAANHYTFGSE